MADVVVIVDQYRRDKDAKQRHQKIDPRREAQGVSQMTKVLGRARQRLALVSDSDSEGFRAYSGTGFQVRTMNGNRSEEIQEFIVEMNETLNPNPPDHLVLVTDDPVFRFLIQNQMGNNKTKVAVWVPGPRMPAAFQYEACDARLLEELLPDIKVPRVDVRLDYENLHVGLQKRGCQPDPRALIQAVQTAVADLGEIVTMVAYADWDLLAKQSKRNIQRELALMGVKTRYQVNLRNKNSSDMEIANDLRTLMEKDDKAPDAADIILIGSGDRDFRATIESAKERGKTVVILALRESLSYELERAATGSVRYLDHYLPELPRQPMSDIKPTHPYAELVLRVITWLQQQGWQWAEREQLIRAITTNPAQEKELQQAIEAGLLKLQKRVVANNKNERREIETLRPNYQETLVQAVAHLIKWTPERIAFCLQVKGMPYVDSNFLAKGMTMDQTLRQLNVGQNRHEAEGWLELVSKVGLIEKRLQPHPKAPDKEITTWWLPTVSQTAVATSTTSDTGEANASGDSNQANPTPIEFVADDTKQQTAIPNPSQTSTKSDLAIVQSTVRRPRLSLAA